VDAVSWAAELRIALREHALAPAAVALAALAAFATWNGERWLDERERVQAAVGAEHAAEDKSRADGFAAIERGEPVPANMRSPMSLWWRHEVFGVEPRQAFALTALGARDLAPPAVGHSDRRMGDAPPDEQRNPALLASGRFDLAFLVTLLLPWFAIALTHRLAAGERESGRWPLLESHAHSPWRVLTLRATWIVTTLALSAGAAVALTLAVLDRLDTTVALQCLAWMATAALVLGFWSALALAIERLERSSAFNLGALGSAWVLLCWAAPVAVGEWVTRRQPVGSRTELARLARKETYAIWDQRAQYTAGVFDALGVREAELPVAVRGVHWSEPAWAVVNSFELALGVCLRGQRARDHRLFDPLRADEWKHNLENLAYSFEAVRRIGPAAEQIARQRRERARLERTLCACSPALAAQQLLLALAGSAPLDRIEFEDALQARQETDRRRLALAVVHGRDLSAEDWKALRAPLESNAASPLSDAAGPAAVLALWLAAAATAAALARARRSAPALESGADARVATA
jgi:hypothetical protein